MLSIFKTPVEKETLDDWAKISVDVAKVAILAVPVVIYGNEAIILKIFNLIFLALTIYSSLTVARKLRILIKGAL
ncbi:hypothetical protein CT138_06680 [Mannheimia varigena]|uniref:hypothetical protein n=1 Tax=Mannheimia varigena TaxID=85404 RepID=UPI000DBEFD7E|nr:hypothetical protein [Mannheimia varigena]AWW34559.1 hypothetical protein CT138_06680 [Mannheimia varigena]